MIRNTFAASLAVAAMACSPAQARDYGEVAGWRLAASGSSCGIYSDKAGNGELIILKNLDGQLHLQVTSRFWADEDEPAVSFEVDRERWSGDFGFESISGDNGRGYVAAFGRGFEQQLRSGSRMTIRRGEQALGSFSLSGSAAALNRLEFCLADLRRDGPAPVMTQAAIAARKITPPQPLTGGGRWFSMRDYPRRAEREGREGTVVFRLTVGTDGRVKSCAITGSSGHRDIDESTCDAAKRRAQFEPAKDGNGNPVEGTYDSRVTWRAPK